MNVFNFYRLMRFAGLVKTSLFAFTAALTPWALAFVFLPSRLHHHHPSIYWIGLTIFLLGFLRLYLQRNQELDDTMKPAEAVFNTKAHAKNLPADAHKKNVLKEWIKQASSEDACGEEDKLNQNQIQHNIQQTHGLFKTIQGVVENHGGQIKTDQNKSLIEMASEYEYGTPTDKEAISLMLVQFKANLWLEVEEPEGTHADILINLIGATDQDLGITEIKSKKQPNSDQCVVTFKLDNRCKRWTFCEPNHYVADNFLQQALKFIGQKANGHFVLVAGEDAYMSYTFLPSRLHKGLSEIFTIKGGS